jgi:hypothetical protein
MADRTDRFETFRKEESARGIPEKQIEDWIAANVLPCASLDRREDAPEGAPIAGAVGGRPHLPADVSLPRLPFLASVDLAAIPPGMTALPLPADGTLLFFADTNVTSSFAGDWAQQLIYVPAGIPVAERRPPADRAEDWPEPFDKAELHVFGEVTVPNRTPAMTVYRPGAEWSDLLWWHAAHDPTRDVTEQGLVQIGGHPWVWFEDPRPDDGWVLLAGIGTEDILDNDHTLTRWVIRPADLAACRFDRAQAFFEAVPRIFACEFPAPQWGPGDLYTWSPSDSQATSC